METINWRRVALGGMVAGAVLTILDRASSVLLGRQGLRMMVQALQPFTSGRTAALFSVLVFLFLGMLMTWWYAAIRPRFGPGPRTAAIAGFAVWLFAVFQFLKSVAMDEPISRLPRGPMVPIVALVMIIASTTAGAWFYQESRR